jgi:hypothetical protein
MKLQIGHVIGLFIAIIIIGCILIPWSKKNTEHFEDEPATETAEGTPVEPVGSGQEEAVEGAGASVGQEETDTLVATGAAEADAEETEAETIETPAPTEDLSQYNFGDNFEFDTSTNAKLLTVFEYILNTRTLTQEYENKIIALKSLLQDKTKVNLVTLNDYKNIIKTLKKALQEELPSKKIIGSYLINRKIQEDKIIDLKTKIALLEDKVNNEFAGSGSSPTTDSNSIKNIRSVLSGINLSVIDLNFATDNRVIMIALNNGFLTYDKDVIIDDKDKNSVSFYPKNKKYYVRHGDKANVKQHFVCKNNNGTNMVIQPTGDPDFFVCVGVDGVSIEKYIPSDINAPIEDPKYQWITSNNQMNGCNKLETAKVTMK